MISSVDEATNPEGLTLHNNRYDSNANDFPGILRDFPEKTMISKSKKDTTKRFLFTMDKEKSTLHDV